MKIRNNNKSKYPYIDTQTSTQHSVTVATVATADVDFTQISTVKYISMPMRTENEWTDFNIRAFVIDQQNGKTHAIVIYNFDVALTVIEMCF